MSDNPLIIPVIVPTGSLHFAAIKPDGDVQEVINVLTRLDEVTSEVLGGLPADIGWALQKIRKEHAGRQWEEVDLEALSDGVLDTCLAASSLASTSSGTPPSYRHFSAFPLTSHLHTPTLRLVSLHPLLSVSLSFLRVPEIHDGFMWKIFLARSTTVREVIDSVSDELGLTKALPVPGGGTIEYVLEEVWVDGQLEQPARVPITSILSEILESPYASNTLSRSARREFRFCVPDEWYRRSKPRSLSTTSLTPSEATIKHLADLEADEDTSDDEDGTAKQKRNVNTPPLNNTPSKAGLGDWKGTFSQNRLSTFFDGWLPSSHTLPQVDTPPRERMSVSEPKLLDQGAVDREKRTNLEEDAEGIDLADFNQMLDDLCLKGPQREKMYELPLEQKKYILQQNRQFGSVSKATSPKSSRKNSQPTTYSPASGVSVVPRLVPQLTGDGFMTRFSVVGWGAGSSTLPSPKEDDNQSLSSASKMTNGSKRRSVEQVEPQLLQPQSTGGMWGSFWTSSGGAKGGDKPQKETPRWYVDGIRNGKTTDMKLIKHLIALRVHLSTANLAWVEEFVQEERGIDALGFTLTTLVRKGGKRKALTEVETSALFELIKCLRVLLNTEPGFDQVLSSPIMITHIAYSLHGSSPKLRSLISNVLAAICVISMTDGHKAVLSALSDYRIEYSESFRFEELIRSLKLPDTIEDEDTGASGIEEDGVWEARTASMSLINALTTCPDSLEDRVLLRDEFTRRGLNELMVTLRYVKPPETLLTQLDVYTEEKFEDEADMRERARSSIGDGRSSPDLQGPFDDLVQQVKRHEDLYPALSEIARQCVSVLRRDIANELKGYLLAIVEKLTIQVLTLEDLDIDWNYFIKEFTSSVSYITGRALDIVPIGHGSDAIIEQELESLRTKVEELNDERTTLRNEIDLQAAELNVLKSLSPTTPVAQGKGGKENVHGLVQRLVQKEKQAVQLQAEVDRYKSQNPNEGRESDDRAKRERDRAKWNTLMDEIAKLKTKNGELEASVTIKEKEALYLKRALESVYSRFHLREENREAEVDAQTIATRAIDSLAEKDIEISRLKSEVAQLRNHLEAKPKFITEKDFKTTVAPPPPPPPAKPKRTLDSPFIPPPTPPPPPPVSESTSSSIPAPPPPPPPPPPHPSVISPSSAPPPPPLPPSPSSSNIRRPPPPPVPPPPPGPPPPPEAFKFGAPKITRSTKRLKPFFWNKLAAPTLASTVWDEVSPFIAFNLEDLEDTFSIDDASTRPSRSSSVTTKKQNVTTVLDITRANNIAIMLSRIKLDLVDIGKALLVVDDAQLSVDDLRSISKHLPTSEEITRIRDFEDVAKLAKADQYFSHIITIPRLSRRLECMLYRRKFELEMEEIRPDLLTIRNACKDLRNSDRFKSVLQAVLAVGNALNGSSFRGGARGFQLEALTKMKETRTAKGGQDCPTLLHYLARVLLRTNPDLVNFIDEMRTVEAAARISVQTVFASVNSFVIGLNQVDNEIGELKKSTVPLNDRFILVMRPFAENARKNVDALQSMASSLESEIRSTLTYFGEAVNTVNTAEPLKPEDFFGMVLSFSSSLQKAALDIHASEEKAAVADRIPVRKATDSDTTTTASTTAPAPSSLMPPSSSAASGKLSVGHGDLDQAIRSMRTGTRRARPNRPLNKIFLDGRQSRAFD